MIVTWTTFDQTNTPTVEFGNNELDRTETGLSTLFTDGGSQNRRMYIHRVVLTQLTPGMPYSKQLTLNYNKLIFKSSISISLRE